MKSLGLLIGTWLLLNTIAFAQIAPEKTWGLCIGIAEYNTDTLALKWADKDAIDFCSLFLDGKLNVPKEQYRIVKDREATRREILNALDWLMGAANPGDRVYIFYSGHGKETSPFLPFDAENQISLDEIKKRLKKIDAQDIIVFADACYSGRLANKGAKFDVVELGVTGLTAQTNTALSQAKRGTVVMTSAKGIQESRELEGLMNGIFTDRLLDVLTKHAQAADANHDGQLTLDEAYRVVSRDVAAKSKQEPQISDEQAAQQVVLFAYALPTPTPSPATPTPLPVQTAILTVRANAGAAVTIDGQAAGVSPMQAKLALGWHRVRVEKTGYLTFEDEIELNYDRTVRVELRPQTSQTSEVSETSEVLTPTPPPAPPQQGGARETPVPSGRVGEGFTDPTTGMEFVWIQGGEFQMGSNDYKSEQPVHQVLVQKDGGFWMGKYEVTQAQWQKIMGSNPSSFKGEKRPVENVSWDDAQDFIRKLNAKTGKNPPLPLRGGEYRLPSEAEWEYACRAGTTTAYSFGDDVAQLKNYAWYGENSNSQTHPVGDKKANAWGLYDMHGNVWEWCADTWHDNYAGAPTDGSIWGSLGDKKAKLLRGGSWSDHPDFVRGANRGRFAADTQNFYIGLRVVCVR